MSGTVSFPFKAGSTWRGRPFFMPFLPVDLRLNGGATVHAEGLLDTGAVVNVLPYDLGLRLGAVWEEEDKRLFLAGSLAREEARGLIVETRIEKFAPVNLAFAWVRSNNVRLLLGHVNFFHEFDAAFHSLHRQFHLRPAEDTDRAA